MDKESKTPEADSVGREHDHTALIKDPIHGSIELHPLLHYITKTPIFHRLKNIKQLSGLHYVYPGGLHTRFEHSIGVCYLAGEYARMLITKYRSEKSQKQLEEDETNILCVQIAGLCHDLGHGPFSHLFEPNLKNYVKRKYNNKELKARKEQMKAELEADSKLKYWHSVLKYAESKISHEMISCLLVAKMYDDEENRKVFNSHGILDKHIRMIQDMIMRPKDFDFGREDLYLYQIVANAETGIDVDKWDYFIRDCHYIGLQHEFDCKRLMQLSKIRHVNEKKQLMICYNKKEINNILGMFRTRCSLHLKAYQHKRVRAVNHMLKEAINGVIDVDLIYDCTRQPKKRSMKDILEKLEDDLDGYLLLDDGIIHVILNTDPQTYSAKKSQIETSQKFLRDLINGKNTPRRLSPEDLAQALARTPENSQNIFDVTSTLQDDLPNEVIAKLVEDGKLIKKDDTIFVEKVKLSYISEESVEIKSKAEVVSEKHEGIPAPAFSPLHKVYVYTNDLKGGNFSTAKDAHKLQEKEYEETLPLFVPKWYKMERCWWYTTLKLKDDEIIKAIADVVKNKRD